ncbi:MAG: hypothetical protein HY652_13425 [Acidobacteria bacterium]|nr:hypothetical protein [Acidobacteriota bacterium]
MAKTSRIAGGMLAILFAMLIGGASGWVLFSSWDGTAFAQAPRRSSDRPLGGNMAPVRVVQDPYPTFTDIAVDGDKNIVVVTDENRFSLLTYDRRLVSDSRAEPRTVITGPKTGLDFACGVDLDPMSREIFTVNNDTGADLMVFDYDANGEVAPLRVLKPAPRGTWGVSVDRKHDEVAVTVQHVNRVAIYRRTAQGDEKPVRIIQGPNTELSDPHGLYVDAQNNEIFVANHDSWHSVETGDTGTFGVSGEITEKLGLRPSTGKFVNSSIAVYSRTANGDVAPLRKIHGPRTQLALPMKIHVDAVHNELAVANSKDDSVLIFSRTADGDAAPLRKIKGPATGLDHPTGVFFDIKNDEVWVANWGNHTATVYRRTAQGNAAPLRTIRSAPKEAPVVGIGNPGGIAYDSKRKQLLIPN